MILEVGDAVPADGRILESASMESEEAALTGESVPVNKTIQFLLASNMSEVLEVPFIAHAFGFTPVSFKEYIVALGLAVLVIPIVEIVKACQRAAAKRK